MKSPACGQFDTSVFSGVRVLANFLVVTIHVFLLPTIILDVPKSVLDLQAEKEPLFALLFLPLFIIGNYAVDTFLFLSGYLFAHSFCRKHPSQNYTLFHAVNHIRHRFIRLLPIFAIAWTIGMWRGNEAGSKLTGLFEIFYLLNCHPDFGKVPFTTLGVITVTWSLSADMQGHIFILLILILSRNNRRAVYFLLVAMVVQMFMRTNFVLESDGTMIPMETMMDVTTTKEIAEGFSRVFRIPMGNITFTDDFIAQNPKRIRDQLLYFSPKLRIAVVFVGYLTWYIVEKRGQIWQWIEAKPLKALAGSIITGLITLVAGLTFGTTFPAQKSHPLWMDAVFEGFHRMLFMACLAVFLIVIGNPTNAAKSRTVRALKFIFSNAVVRKIAPLSYAVYLLHPFLVPVITNVYPRVTKENYEIWRFAVSTLQLYFATVVVAVPCHQFENLFIRYVQGKSKPKLPSEENMKIKNKAKEQ